MTDRPLWRQGRFGRFWGASAVSDLGDRVSELALPMVAILALDASAPQVAGLTAAAWVPSAAGLVVGTWVDRLRSKRQAMIVADLLRGAAMLSVPLVFALDSLSLAFLYAVAIVRGLLGVVFGTAAPNFFARLVPRERYVEANSLTSGTRSISFVVGPPIAGGLVQVLTAPVTVLVDGLSFLVSAVLLRTVPVDEPAAAHDTPEPFLRRIRSGLTYLLRHPYLQHSLRCSTTLNLFSFMVQGVLLVYAARDLALSAGQIGLALGGGAIGGLVGSVLASRLTRLIGAGRSILLGCVALGLPYAALPLAADLGAAGRLGVLAAVEFVSGFGVMLFDINNNAIQTVVTHDSMRSRVSGAYMTINYGIRPVGALLGGWSAAVAGTGTTLVIAAIGGALAALWLLPGGIPAIRSADELSAHLPGPA
ncbi:MFS transporter [Metallococcus carri]|uniref:MFS transporter n=1 Tax=Metallococcus carri TaxID=1656884 RepID=UPI002E288EA3|nr:MFS transporter [Metallococcus carri]